MPNPYLLMIIHFKVIIVHIVLLSKALYIAQGHLDT